MLLNVVLWILLLCYFVRIAFLVINGFIVLRREGRSLPLLIPLVLGLILIIPLVYMLWSVQLYGSDVTILISILVVVTICFMLFGALTESVPTKPKVM
ncbi:hypothetical protein JJQ73_03870 [Corynebacterium glutamicum]|uniref:hypothetical protein n=1 Tax=Corynebacterium glutamicum TaxID=1718 RepID=UPI001C6E2DB1|nr:hypothetical protein [Corynebacterium glutamicum]QYR18215.1 hypothetical protein JJQ73_03870 [Corynebacterium glutamicum]